MHTILREKKTPLLLSFFLFCCSLLSETGSRSNMHWNTYIFVCYKLGSNLAAVPFQHVLRKGRDKFMLGVGSLWLSMSQPLVYNGKMWWCPCSVFIEQADWYLSTPWELSRK